MDGLPLEILRLILPCIGKGRCLSKMLKEKVETYNNLDVALSKEGASSATSDFIGSWKGRNVGIGCKHTTNDGHAWVQSLMIAFKSNFQVSKILVTVGCGELGSIGQLLTGLEKIPLQQELHISLLYRGTLEDLVPGMRFVTRLSAFASVDIEIHQFWPKTEDERKVLPRRFRKLLSDNVHLKHLDLR
jgi:hypothetical protein